MKIDQHRSHFALPFVIFIFMASYVDAQNQESDFKPNGKIWGYIFGDVIYKAGGDTLSFGRSEFAKEEKGVIGGKLRRLYFGYDNNLSDQWFVRVLFESGSGITTTKNEFTTKIKLGYLQYSLKNSRFLHNAKISVGLVPTPTFAFPERAWGYRSVEKEALDLRGFGSSADQGVSLEGNFSENKILGYNIMVSNGVGSKPEVNKSLQYHVSIFANLFDNRIKLETFANYTKDKKGLNRWVTRQFITYSVENFRFGFEGSKNFIEELGKQDNISKVKELQPLLLSTFVSTKLKSSVWVYLRYDYFNPDTKFDSDFTYADFSQNYNEHLFIGGFQIEIHNRYSHNISIMPNFHINAYEKKKPDLAGRRADIVMRTTLYYNF